MRHVAPSAARGFTLLEVLVALVVVALGMSALLETLTQSARNVADLRERTVAEWIAMNQLALARLSFNAPTTGVTSGDVDDCANGNWHWQQSISAVSAIPGLMSITVKVRRTGNATRQSRSSPLANAVSPDSGGNSADAAHPGATGQLGPSVSLGPTAALGSVTALSSAGCASAVAAGNSLGPGGAGSPGQTSQSLGAHGQLGAGSGLTGFSLVNSGSGSQDGSLTGPADSANSSSSSSSSSASSSSSGAAPWLATLTGFRGNTLGPASGESPNWAGTPFPGQGGANGSASNGNGTTMPATPALGTSPPLNSPVVPPRSPGL